MAASAARAATQARGLALPYRAFWIATAAALVLAGCGATGFERTSGSKRYRQLPVGAAVRVAESQDLLPQPVEVLGTLKTITRGDPANRPEAENAFRKFAARYGCDAVSDLASIRREVQVKRKTPTLAPDGTRKYVEEVEITPEHDWTALCVRTADAPPDASAVATPVKPAPEPEPPVEPKKIVKKGKGDQPKHEPKPEPVKPEPKVEPVKPEPKPLPPPKPEPVKPEPVKPEPKVEPIKPEPKPLPPPKPEPVKPEPKVEPVKPEPKVEPPKPEPKPLPPPKPEPVADAAPVLPPADAKVAIEVAKFFRTWSKQVMTGNVDALCGSLDEQVLFDISASQPKFKFKATMTAPEACESLRTGELAGYLREFGPAELHAEVEYVLPTLFAMHGKPFLKLDEATQRKYADDVNRTRTAENKKPLACTSYAATPMGDENFVITMGCQGVQAFRLIVKRPAEGSFKLMRLIHQRP